MSLKQLPLETIKLISSAQVITSASSVVKELMENSIDARATIIDIHLENYGLDKIEIRDNGIGISCSDVHVMFLRGYTSKISDISDLDQLMSYGFRGEALSSICAVADVTIITKTEFDKYAQSFIIDKNGHVKSSSISHHQRGTVIKIVDLFKNLPVRKQLYNSKKYCVNDLRRIENIIKSLYAIQQNIRVSLVHNKCVLWQMSPVSDIKITFGQIWSSSMTKYVKHLQFSNEEMKIDIVLPVQNIDVQNCFFTTNIADSIYLYVNKRPIRDNKIEKLIVGEFNNYFGHYLSPGKYLPCFISLSVPATSIDVNLEPDKSRILFHNQEIVIINIQNIIRKHFYCDKIENNQSNINEIQSHPSNKRKTSFDLKAIRAKKPVIFMSQIDSLSTEFNNEDYPHIPIESILKDIDSKEPSTSKENKNDEIICSESNELEKTYGISEYCENQICLKQTVPYKTIQSNNANVTNVNAENILASQWSQGGVVINEKLLESGMSIKSDTSSTTLENKLLLDNENASEIFHSKYTAENQRNKLNAIEEKNPVLNNKSISETLSNNDVTLEPHCSLVSIPDEKVPLLNHLDNNPRSWIPEPILKKSTQDVPGVELSKTIQCVSSQMGNKEMSGFKIFAKELRIKILQENPGMDFTKVSKELVKLWACLNVDEKNRYKELANKQKNLKVIAKINDTSIPKKSFQYIFKTLKRCSTSINIELSEIKKNIFEKPKLLKLSPFILIGEVKENNWMCCVQNEIKALNICRLQEAVVFFQKMVDEEIPLKMLCKSINISKKYLGEKNYCFLRNLDTSYEPSAEKYTITDERIVKNGFKVVFVFNDDPENPDINITDVALHISTYGTEEFKELLELMQLEKENGLYFYRPLKVVNYLRSETARHCKTIGLPKTKKEIYELLNYWFKNENLSSNNKCIHYKQVFTSVHIIDENSKTFKC
ncbi:PMS1 protein homolog 1-like isoform X2 [Sipha flava]|uniref:PMS1 protein homolog 1-like isoform X2 n=2 Tax=Sipha flava TaxID=143950 RepID=A0A8B8GQS4_9HEMI|nr:PMS1 protein homolog 1-like isoform X2 [Sipha flava]